VLEGFDNTPQKVSGSEQRPAADWHMITRDGTATHHRATVKFVVGNGANHMVCGWIFFKGGHKVIALPAHAPVKEVYSFTDWVGTPFTTRFSDDCYAKATPYKNYLIQGNRTLNGF